MKNLVIGVALAALLSAAPALAKDKKTNALKGEGAQQSTSTEENANRLQNEDGTFQGKPVVQGPAHWEGVGAASSGASSGESGSGASSGEAGSGAESEAPQQ